MEVMDVLSEQTVQDEEEFLEWLRKQTGLFAVETPVSPDSPVSRPRKPVQGRLTATKCGVRCRAALSRHCSCSCGGALHGSFV